MKAILPACPICGGTGRMMERACKAFGLTLTGKRYFVRCDSCGRESHAFSGGFTAANGRYISADEAIQRAAADFTADGRNQ